MKTISIDYKETIKTLGRELDSKITYTIDNETIELGMEDLNAITPSYQADILKSVMKQLEIDSKVDIPLETIINYRFGVKVNGVYEYINFGNYIVAESEKQEDLDSYKITCYDKMLYTMKEYGRLNVSYPTTIRDYIKAICNKLGFTFKNENENFANYNRVINEELYLGFGYTYRDVLDELAQVTASTICINENDELELRYINTTNDIIDEEFLKNINVNFGEKYGPINSIVLSRSAGSDNVYLSDETSIEENGLTEIKISDNQIMNFNDRSEYLPAILAELNGLTYYINDYASTGITYYEMCDGYTVQVGENQYPCVMFNDEVLVTQGLEENIYTELPETSETDYSKADKTDRKINQTYLIVDKQNQQITSVVSEVDGQNQKISQLTQTVSELSSKIGDALDVTISGESDIGYVVLTGINASQPITVEVHPINSDLGNLYPREDLYPGNALYPHSSVLRFTNMETGEVFNYEFPSELLWLDSETYDVFYMAYDEEICQITRNVGVNPDGTRYKLTTPVVEPYPYPGIDLTTGDRYTIELVGVQEGYLFVRLMASNMYTSQFATRTELSQTANSITTTVEREYATKDLLNSTISQTADEINLEVSKKVGKDTIISSINQSAEQIQINANKISLAGKTINLTSDNIAINSTNFQVDKNGNVTAKNGNFSGVVNASSGKFTGEVNATSGSFSGTVNATSGSFRGSIYSSSGTIGGLTLSGSGLSSTRAAVDGTNGILRCFNTDGGSMIFSNAARISATAGVGISSNSNGNVSAPARNIDIKACNGASVYMGSMSNTSGSSENNAVTVTPSSIILTRNPTIGSDRRLKDKIQDVKDVSWIDDLKVKEYEYKNTPGIKNIGLIAQDYENKDYSKYFLSKDEKDYYSVAYGNITNALIQYCQDLRQEVNTLKEEIKQLKEEK